MQSFALYRLPYAKMCTFLTGEVHEVVSMASLSGRQGFVMAPFFMSTETPLLLIAPHSVMPLADVSDLPLDLTESLGMSSQQPRGDLRTAYHIDFLNFHAHLLNGSFQKLVLARSMDVARKPEVSPLELFRRACDSYPRMFIALVFTPQSGLWLVATPETLLAGIGNQWQTMALAGTQPFTEDVSWKEKDVDEQRYVSTYITHQLERYAHHLCEDGPYTTRAGHLAHLRSDFHFTMNDPSHVGDLLYALHPTPAVGGLPKQEAFRFIRHYEHQPRQYYSGFLGPLHVRNQTHLFVTLRCMRIYDDVCRLYAGGGLLRESVEESEWQETETKLDTMRRII
jgi:isochorismate synthase